MDKRIEEKCRLLIKNREIADGVFKWEIEYMSIAAAAVLTSIGEEVDASKIKACGEILKKKTGILSSFRGNSQAVVLAKMASSYDPEMYLDNVIKVYGILNNFHVIESDYKVLSAMSIVDHAEPADYDKYISRTAEIYKQMKKNHQILTGAEDIPFATMLALTDKDISFMIKDMEKSYELLKKNFFSKDPVQSLTHVLTLNDMQPEYKCERVMQIFETLKQAKHKYGTGYELATLGTLTVLDLTPIEIAQHIADVDNFLKSEKGFGNFVLGAENRRMLATLVVVSTLGEESSVPRETITSSLMALTIALEAAVMICIMSSTMAASST